jgi:rfaE bifunctional protein nucleotidyltransferase chain/domain
VSGSASKQSGTYFTEMSRSKSKSDCCKTLGTDRCGTQEIEAMNQQDGEKVLSLAALTERVNGFRKEGLKVVHCHGVFDLLHIGHIRYFEQAGRLGDILVVTVTPDKFVDKGPHRPAFEENLRAEAVASLHCVDFVALNLWPTAEETLRMLRPDVYVKGAEFKNMNDITGKIAKEAEVVREVGAKLAFTEDIVFSSSHLINHHLSNYPKEIAQYLELFRNRYDVEEILDYLEQPAPTTVLVVGDTILDEYQHCSAIGKSTNPTSIPFSIF